MLGLVNFCSALLDSAHRYHRQHDSLLTIDIAAHALLDALLAEGF